MRVCSHQPSFFPWIGYWNKVDSCDLLVMSAGVKMDYSGYQNRVQLNGHWLTVPVTKGSKHLPIKDVRFDRDGFQKTMFTARQALGGKRWPNGQVLREIIDETIRRVGGTDFLLDMNVIGFEVLREALGVKTAFIVDETEPEEGLTKTQRLVSRVGKYVGKNAVYRAGPGIEKYLDAAHWNPDIKLEVQTQVKQVDNGTILQLIAQTTQPLEAIRSSFGWSRVNVGEKHTDNRAACG